MKKILVLLLFVPALSFAQKLKIEVDKMKGDTTISTTETFIVGHSSGLIPKKSLSFICYKKNASRFILFDAEVLGNDIFSLRRGDSVEIKLDDNTIIGLPYPYTRLSDYSIGSSKTMFITSVPLDEEYITALKKHKVTFIRFNTSSVNQDFEISNDKQDLIMKAVNLIY